MIDLNEVYVFIKVVEAGSFAGASKQLNMPSTTVSRKIQKLEATLGVRLLQRTTRKLHLTDIGQHYFDNCQQSLLGIEQANALANKARTTPTGLLRITSPTDFATNYLQPWINDFLTLHPDVQIELEVTDRFVDIIEERIDIAFRSGELKDSTLIARRIGPKQDIVCASPDYILRKGQPKTPEDLSQHDCIIMGHSLKNQSWQFITQKNDISVPVTGRYAVDNMQLVTQAAINSMGVAKIPYPLVQDALASGRLVRILADYSIPIQNMSIIYPSHKHLASNVRIFIDHVIALIQPNAPWDITP